MHNNRKIASREKTIEVMEKLVKTNPVQYKEISAKIETLKEEVRHLLVKGCKLCPFLFPRHI